MTPMKPQISKLINYFERWITVTHASADLKQVIPLKTTKGPIM
jgi:hypothetical protein